MSIKKVINQSTTTNHWSSKRKSNFKILCVSPSGRKKRLSHYPIKHLT